MVWCEMAADHYADAGLPYLPIGEHVAVECAVIAQEGCGVRVEGAEGLSVDDLADLRETVIGTVTVHIPVRRPGCGG